MPRSYGSNSVSLLRLLHPPPQLSAADTHTQSGGISVQLRGRNGETIVFLRRRAVLFMFNRLIEREEQNATPRHQVSCVTSESQVVSCSQSGFLFHLTIIIL